MRHRFFVSFLLGCLFCCRANDTIAQQQPYQHIALTNYSLPQGLPSTLVYYLYQDSKGFIWIATDRGVSRFDGRQFQNFTSAEGLESNEVFRIAEDRYHRIFFYCDNYRVCYYENGRINRLASRDKILWPPTASMCFNRYNELCVIYGLRPIIYRFPELNVKPHNMRDTANTVYGANNEAVTLTGRDDKMIRETLAADSFPASPNYIKPYRLEVKGKYVLLICKKWVQVYYSTASGLKPLHRYDIEGEVNAVNLIGGNKFCVSTFKKGLYVFDFEKHTRVNYLNGSITTHALTDSEGNLWMGTFDKGLYLGVNPGVQLLDASSGLANDHILRLAVLNNRLFAGHILTGVSIIQATGPQTYAIDTLNLKQGRSDFNRITSFLPVKNKFMVIGTDNGIWKLDASKTSSPAWPRLMYTLGPVKDIIEHNDTVSYINHNAIRVISDWNKMFGWYFVEGLRPTSFALYRNYKLVGTMYGLYRVDYHKGNDNSTRTRLFEKDGVRAVRSLAVNGARYAIATEDNGLFIFDGSELQHINTPTLPSSDVRRVVWTDANTLWACTSSGAVMLRFRADGALQKHLTFNTSLGLPSDNVADIAKTNGHYFLATDQGIAVVPENLEPSKLSPILIAESKKENDQYHFGEAIKLQYYAISYKSLGTVSFRYRLKGVDTNWTASTSGEKEFIRLSPGSYQLEVVAIDRFNHYSPPIITRFAVLPAWYQYVWLQALAALAMLFLLFVLVRRYYLSVIRLQRQDFEREMALQAERQRISTEVHDDLGASISGIKLQTELLTHKAADKDVQLEIAAIYEAITDISTQVRLIIWSLDMENDDVSSLIIFIRNQAKKLFAHKNIRLEEQITDESSGLVLRGELRRQVFLFVKEAFNNIIKHANADEVNLQISVIKRTFTITIRDNGQGFEVAAARSAANTGLRNMRSRAAGLKATFKISSDSKGTTIVLKVPL
ncbi:sensor histidine kinase [Mucilaginibacter pedocola]|uniref:histidine kinase n=1 Tax=Mucilaginibacter pedocola TaxID=1792845 RepID=A0A1S9PMN6_9SPHI|nr:two-component regulator propeller domain-containing protein [Mucilaginibacter pedocola]OOQ62215.1 hypothetical protein BC343_04005 [Mucilaginibacter pedocola]